MRHTQGARTFRNGLAGSWKSNAIAPPSTGGLISTKDGLEVKWFIPEEAPPISLCEGPAANRQYGNGDILPWREELLPYPMSRGFVKFYDNLAEAIRCGAPLTITPESVRDNVAVLELCRKQNPGLWAGF